MTTAPWRVKHLRLFGFRVEAETAIIRWLLNYAGKYDDVEHIEVNAPGGEVHTVEFHERNPNRMLPLLEVVLDGAKPCPPTMGPTTKVSDLKPWKAGAPECTTETADGKTIANPNDRVFTLTEGGAISSFLCTHFEINDLHPKSVFQRCRCFELITHKEILFRRVATMILIPTMTRCRGLSEEDIITFITTHEAELLWTFRQFEDIFTAREKSAARAVGANYNELLALGEKEIAEQEKLRNEVRAASSTPASTESNPVSAAAPPSSSTKKTKDSGKKTKTVTIDEKEASDATATADDERSRGFTSPTLVALNAFVGGEAISLIDLYVTYDLQMLPLLQSWLPDSLTQRNFPATLRYLTRMRNVRGFDAAVKPTRSFMKMCRRYSNALDKSPVMDFHSARVRQAVEAKKAAEEKALTERSAGQTTNQPYRPDPRMLPQQHFRALPVTQRPLPTHSDDAPRTKRDRNPSPKDDGQSNAAAVSDSTNPSQSEQRSQITKESHDGTGTTEIKNDDQATSNPQRGRPLVPHNWAPRICVVPISAPFSLSAEDEAALRRSNRPKTKRSARSADPSIRLSSAVTPSAPPNAAPASSDARASPVFRKSPSASSRPSDAAGEEGSRTMALVEEGLVENPQQLNANANATPANNITSNPILPQRSQTAQPSDRRSADDVSIVMPPRQRTWRHDPYKPHAVLLPPREREALALSLQQLQAPPPPRLFQSDAPALPPPSAPCSRGGTSFPVPTAW